MDADDVDYGAAEPAAAQPADVEEGETPAVATTEGELEEGEVAPAKSSAGDKRTCPFFMKGSCRFGLNCDMVHPGHEGEMQPRKKKISVTIVPDDSFQRAFRQVSGEAGALPETAAERRANKPAPRLLQTFKTSFDDELKKLQARALPAEKPAPRQSPPRDAPRAASPRRRSPPAPPAARNSDRRDDRRDGGFAGGAGRRDDDRRLSGPAGGWRNNDRNGDRNNARRMDRRDFERRRSPVMDSFGRDGPRYEPPPTRPRPRTPSPPRLERKRPASPSPPPPSSRHPPSADSTVAPEAKRPRHASPPPRPRPATPPLPSDMLLSPLSETPPPAPLESPTAKKPSEKALRKQALLMEMQRIEAQLADLTKKKSAGAPPPDSA